MGSNQRSDAAIEALRAAGLRITPQRAMAVRSALDSQMPFTADDLIDGLRRAAARPSRATVYRALQVMLDRGMIRRLPLNEDAAFYEVPPVGGGSRYYVRCLDCQRIYPFSDPCFELREASVAMAMGYRIREESVVIDGHCLSACEKGRCGRCAFAKVARRIRTPRPARASRGKPRR